MQKSSVTFRPTQTANVPNMITSFPAVPSAYYYYLDSQGNQVALPNNLGTPQEQEISLIIWYSMKGDDVFPLKTAYVQAREEQIGLSGNNRPASTLSLSMKSRLRQYPAGNDWIFDDRFQMILSQMKRSSLTGFINDFYRFPLSPSADAFAAARLLEQYMRDGNETPIRKYFANRGVVHLKEHPLGYYPLYYLFFLMTRYASYPMSEDQLRLAEARLQTDFESPARIFIDAIFEYEIYNMQEVLNLINQIKTQGPAAAGAQYGTTHSDWVRWANEYLESAGVTAEPIDNLGAGTFVLAEKLNTWTDNQVEQMADALKLELPFRIEYPTRYAYLSSVAGTITYYRASEADTLRWIEMTHPAISEVGST